MNRVRVFRVLQDAAYLKANLRREELCCIRCIFRTLVAIEPSEIGRGLGPDRMNLMPVRAYPYWHQVQFEERNPKPV